MPDRLGGCAGEFERVVQQALEGLPPEFRRLLATVAVVVEDLPTPEQAHLGGAPDGWLYGLYVGTPATDPWADHVVAPNVITIFRIPLQEDFRHRRDALGDPPHGHQRARHHAASTTTD